MAWNLSIYLDRHVARDSISTSSAGPAKGLLARRPDLIIEAGGTFSAIEVASKAQRGNLVAARAEEGLEAALGNGEATGINSVGFTLPWSIGGVRTVGASSLPATYGIGAAGALDVGIGASRATPEAIAAYSQRIAGAWTGTFGQYTVTTQVTTPAPETPRSQYNVVDISPLAGNATNGTPFTNAVGGSYINVASLTTGSNPVNSIVPMLITCGRRATSGHAMGLADMYSHSTQRPLPGYETNIMAVPQGVPEAQDISNILYMNSIGYSAGNGTFPGPSGGSTTASGGTGTSPMK